MLAAAASRRNGRASTARPFGIRRNVPSSGSSPVGTTKKVLTSSACFARLAAARPTSATAVIAYSRQCATEVYGPPFAEGS